MKKRYMARDQYGNTHHNLGQYPRKALMDRLGFKSARRMWENLNGLQVHVGWVIGGHWLKVYRVEPMKISG